MLYLQHTCSFNGLVLPLGQLLYGVENKAESDAVQTNLSGDLIYINLLHITQYNLLI